MKDRLTTTSIREIKGSIKRFISLVVMSLLGVLVFVGLKQSSPDMLKSLDTYYDNDNHYDIKIVSTLGLTNNDINKLKRIKGIKEVEGAYSKDVLINVNNDESVIKIIGIPNIINNVNNETGKMPTNNNEILVEQNLLDEQHLKVGDNITIEDSDFKEKQLKIVGTVKSSMFISSTTGALNRGNTTIGSGHVSYYVYGLNSNFNLDYYTELYINVSGAKNLLTDSVPYNNRVNKTLSNIDKIKDMQASARYDEIYNKINDEIKKQEQEGLNKLYDAKNQLDNANYELVDNKNKLDEAGSKLDSVKLELDNNKAKLDEAKKELDLYDKKLNDAKELLDAGKNEINNELSDYGIAYEDIDEVLNTIVNYELSKDEVISAIPSDVPYYDQTINAISSIYDSGLIDNVKDFVEGNITKENLINIIPDTIPYYDDVIDFINNTTREDVINYITSPDNVDSLISMIPINTPYYDEIVTALNDYKQNAPKFVELVGAIKDIRSGQKQYNDGLDKYNKALNDYNNGYNTYLSYLNEYNKNFKTYNDGLKTYNAALTIYNSHLVEYNDQMNMFNIKILEAKNKLNEIPEAKWYTYNRLDDSEYTSFIDDGKSVTNLAKLFPSIFYIVAILISLISMSRMVEDDRSEIGTLKSLGFSNKHIRRKYLIYSGVATLVGGILGALIGFFALPYIIWNIYKILFDVPVFVYDYNPINSIIGITIALVCVCGTTILTIRKVVKEKPSELMRPKAPSNGKRVILEKIPFIWKHVNFSNKITIRNLFRYKKRVFMMVIGILGCTSLLLAGFGIRDSIVTIPSKQYGEIFHFDEMVYLDNLNETETNKIFDNKFVKNRLDTMMSSSYEVGNNSVYIMVVNKEEDIKNVLELNELNTGNKISLKENEVIISDKLSSLINKKKGDIIKVDGPDNKSYTFKISDVYENYASHYIIMNKDTYEDNIGSFTINAAYVNLKNVNDENMAIKHLMKSDKVISVMSIKTTIKSVDNMLKSLDSVVIILIVLSGSLSFVILYNLSYINITERKREIATLKVLGFTDKEVDNYIIKENIILTILGIVLGLLFGIFLTNIIVDTIEISQVRFLHLISKSSFIITSLFIMGFTIIVNIITHYTLKKIDMIESLKSVE